MFVSIGSRAARRRLPDYKRPINLGTFSTGTIPLDPRLGRLQYLTCNGAITLAEPTVDGEIELLIANGASAGAITFQGFSGGGNSGDTLTTRNLAAALVSIRVINGVAMYNARNIQLPPGFGGSSPTSTTTTSPITVNLPSGIVAGDFLIAIGSRLGNGTQTFTWPAGWTSFYGPVNLNSGSATAHAAWKRVATGDAEIGASTMSVSSSLTTSQQQGFAVERWTDVHATQAPEKSADAIATNTNSHAPNSLTPSWGAALNEWLVLSHWYNTGTFSGGYTSAPTGYTDGAIDAVPDASGSRCGVGMGGIAALAATQAPGNVSYAGTGGVSYVLDITAALRAKIG